MSTRSRIAKQSADGSITMIYCHSDGYITYNGRILLTHYQDESKITRLLSLGDISFLAPDIGVKHSFDIPMPIPDGYWDSDAYKLRQSMVLAYGRDRGEKNIKAQKFSSLDQIPEELYEDYFYLRRDGKWFFSEHGTFTDLTELTRNLIQAELDAEEQRIAEYNAKRKGGTR